MKKTFRPELLLPAANPEVMQTAFRYGADAVYIGGEAFSLRAKADNFSLSEMKESVGYAHALGKKVYVTANIFAHNEDIPEIRRYFEELKNIGPDALLISDPGVYSIASEVCPEIPRHISTQSNNTNYDTCLFWHRLGAERIVMGRELSLSEIREIRDHIPEDLELEAFIHGSMCISYSGRCLLSNYMTARDANRGSCTHPCRWKYTLMEEQRPGEYFPVFENDRGTYIFNSKDLCMIEHIPEMIEAGIDSFKIEGRMKTALYVAVTARTYRRAIDDYLESPEKYAASMEWYKSQIGYCTNRDHTTGFFFGHPGSSEQIYDSSTYRRNAVFLGIAEGPDRDGRTVLIQKNKFCVGDRIQIMDPSGEDIETEVRGIYDENGMFRDSAPHAKQELHVEFSAAPKKGCVLRRIL